MPTPCDITIDRLRLSLPAAWRGREQLVARALAHELTTINVPVDLDLDSLHLPPVEIRGGDAWQVVVKRIAAQVQDQLLTAAIRPDPTATSPLSTPSHA